MGGGTTGNQRKEITMSLRWIVRDGEKVLQYGIKEPDLDGSYIIFWHDVPVYHDRDVSSFEIGNIPVL
jgi:hypothetical protein